jgi:hypothetical protein
MRVAAASVIRVRRAWPHCCGHAWEGKALRNAAVPEQRRDRYECWHAAWPHWQRCPPDDWACCCCCPRDDCCDCWAQ